MRGWWRRWPDANVGLATGVAFDVCDVDAPDGQVALRDLFDRDGWPEPGPLVRTGGGGWHLLFAPTGLGCPSPRGLTRVDWRGRGGMIVAPPFHPRQRAPLPVGAPAGGRAAPSAHRAAPPTDRRAPASHPLPTSR